MKNKRKAIILIVVFAVLTILDLLFTWIATPNLLMEANELARWAQRYGLGWLALFVSNIVVFVVFVFVVWYSFVIYQRSTVEATGFLAYVNSLEQKRKASPFLAALGYAMGYSMVIGRTLPVVDWAVYLAGYRMPWYEIIKQVAPKNRPDLCLIFILAIVFVVVWYLKEYHANQKRFAALSVAEEV